MLETTYEYLDFFKAPSRRIVGSITYINNDVEYELAPNNNLKSFRIEKTSPKGKFFGFAVSQRITIETIGIVNNIQKGDKLIPHLGIRDYEEDLLLPYFYVDTIEVNKVNNTTTITGYDVLHKADFLTIGSLTFSYPMYISAYARQVCEAIGAYGAFEGIDFLLRESPNFSGNESLHTALTAIAEYTGTICYVSQEDKVRFRTLSASEFTDVLTADDYYNLSIGEITTLTKIASGTELGSNFVNGTDGFTQVLWENPFLNLKDDDIVNALTSIGNKVRNLSNVNYNIEWRGCPAYEIGDFIILQDKEQSANYVFYLNETLEYNGGLKATSEWEAGDGDSDVKPSGISQTLRQTYAKVDKVNQEIELLASKIEEVDPDAISEQLASFKLTADSISQEVSSFRETTTETITALGNRVNSSITSEEASLLIQEMVGNGATSITTETGYVFNKDGLTISKSDSPLSTQITENGLTVNQSGNTRLIVNNLGVYAENLSATTYLIIGERSRFENYDNGNRTGCFWIGE